MKFITRLLPFTLFAPLFAFAAGEFTQLGSFLQNIVAFANNILVPLLFVVAFLTFIWGAFQYFIFGGEEEESREKGRSKMIWGIVGFVLMVSVWGIVNLFANGLGLKQSSVEGMPEVRLTR